MAAKFGLLGEKLGHSFSPMIHGLLGDYEYKLYEVEKDKLAEFMKETDLSGFNVTIPYKRDVIPFCSELSERAKAIGSVNTVVRKPDGTFYGDNTDYYGFEYLASMSGIPIKGKKAIVLGSGGASKTVCAVLKNSDAEVTVISRSGEDNYDNISKHYDAEIIVNTTPLGMYPNNGVSAIEVKNFTKCTMVLDLVYNPEKTEIILQAEDMGIPAYSGLRMLVAQAKMAAELFMDKKIDDSENERIFDIISKDMRNILIIGMPGSGKSTVSRRLSKITGRQIIDTDDLVVELAGKPIPQIFKDDGEEAFRKLETKALSEASKKSGIIIATGGGIVTRPENRKLIRQNSTCVFINRDVNKLPSAGRPLSQSKGPEQLYNERYPLYCSWADITVDNNGSMEDTISAIRKELSL